MLTPPTPAPCHATLFGDDSIGPLHQRNKDSWVTELRAPIGEIIFRNPTGSRASSSRKHGNVFGDDFLSQFTEWWPTNRNHGIRRGLAHQIRGVSRQEYLHFVTGIRQRQRMGKHKRGSRRVAVPQELLIMIFRAFFDSWAFAPSARKGRPINCDKNLRLAMAVFSRLLHPNGRFGRSYIAVSLLSIVKLPIVAAK